MGGSDRAIQQSLEIFVKVWAIATAKAKPWDNLGNGLSLAGSLGGCDRAIRAKLREIVVRSPRRRQNPEQFGLSPGPGGDHARARFKISLGDRHGEGQTLNNLVYQSQGRWEEAIAQYEQSLEIINRSVGDRHGEGKTLNNLGLVYQSQGRWEEAIAQYKQDLEICRSLGDRHGEGQTLKNLGNLYQDRQQSIKANEYWQEALTKLHPDSPDARSLTHRLQNPATTVSRKQRLLSYLSPLALLTFAAFNLWRGHWLIALLTLLTSAGFIAYRIWKRRQGSQPASNK